MSALIRKVILTCTFVHLSIMNTETTEYSKSLECRHITIGKRSASVLRNQTIDIINTYFNVIVWYHTQYRLHVG